MALGDWIKIDGRVWNVIVSSVEEEATVLYSEQTGRTIAPGAPMSLDPLGTFIGHKIEILPVQGDEEDFDGLFNLVTLPRQQGIYVDLVHGQTTLNYLAYISTASRQLKRIYEDAPQGHKVHWDKMKLNIIPMNAQILP